MGDCLVRFAAAMRLVEAEAVFSAKCMRAAGHKGNVSAARRCKNNVENVKKNRWEMFKDEPGKSGIALVRRFSGHLASLRGLWGQ